MSTIGVNISVDVTKLRKERFYKGKKGTYADLTVFINSDKDDYGKNGGIMESLSQEERDSGAAKNWLGDAKVFWSDIEDFKPKQESVPASAPVATNEFEDDIPF